MRVIIAGIGTEIGKTVVSAIYCKAFAADYWKPVQAGELDYSDSHKVAALSGAKTWPEAYRLQHPMSPHAAAALEQIRIEPQQFQVPETAQNLVVELAGGLMVPLNEHYLNIDLAAQLGYPVVLVSRYYLGSINHTLLSIAMLRQRGLDIAGIVFNGERNEQSRSAILQYSDLPVLLDIDEHPTLDASLVAQYAETLRNA